MPKELTGDVENDCIYREKLESGEGWGKQLPYFIIRRVKQRGFLSCIQEKLP